MGKSINPIHCIYANDVQNLMLRIMSLYSKVVQEFIEDKNASILVGAGDMKDKKIFEKLGYTNVVISNILNFEDNFSPYSFRQENAECFSFPDETFDYAIIHAGVHHTRLPHKTLTEMYRVAIKGVLIFEGHDSLLIRITQKLGLTQEYEVAENSTCGVNGTDVPNYIFRWTRREVEKTIKSYAPAFKHRFLYKHATRYPNGFDLSKSKRLLIKLLYPLFLLLVILFPSQQNNFVIFIEKPSIQDSLLPWLTFDQSEKKIKYNKPWVDKYYRYLRMRKALNNSMIQ